MMERGQHEQIDLDDGADESGSEFHLAEYWAVVVKRARLILLCVVVALAVGAIRSLMAKPTYRAIVTVDIGKDKGSPYDVSDR
ncbi:MAG: Wzz/FepE/Etk N-terminal domain-containing protein, partial [Thermoanaerobaculia bacterium]